MKETRSTWKGRSPGPNWKLSNSLALLSQSGNSSQAPVSPMVPCTSTTSGRTTVIARSTRANPGPDTAAASGTVRAFNAAVEPSELSKLRGAR